MENNIDFFQFCAYLETTGGPVCIMPLHHLDEWKGSIYEDESDYLAISSIYDFVFMYKQSIIFASETGNFVVFRSKKGEWAILEIIAMANNYSIPWEGIVLTVGEKILDIHFNERSMIAFDSSLTIKSNDLLLTGVYSSCSTHLMDIFRFNADIKAVYALSLKDDLCQMEGILLKSES